MHTLTTARPPLFPQVRSKFMTLEPNGNRYIRHFDSIRIIQAR